MPDSARSTLQAASLRLGPLTGTMRLRPPPLLAQGGPSFLVELQEKIRRKIRQLRPGAPATAPLSVVFAQSDNRQTAPPLSHALARQRQREPGLPSPTKAAPSPLPLQSSFFGRWLGPLERKRSRFAGALSRSFRWPSGPTVRRAAAARRGVSRARVLDRFRCRSSGERRC